jgi:hypothetical protein
MPEEGVCNLWPIQYLTGHSMSDQHKRTTHNSACTQQLSFVSPENFSLIVFNIFESEIYWWWHKGGTEEILRIQSG